LSFAFQYSEKIDPQSLFQGDLLVKNAALMAALAQAHAYYADATDYTHFMVLTQSCDLVRRGGKPPKSRYITLAAARPLTVVVDRLIAKTQLPNPPTFPLALCDASRKVFIRQALERLLHNTETGYFFLRANSHKAIDTDLCVFLPLSVALRADHYNTCLEAKILQLSDVFQAKVGWLAGDLYSKVGTPDFEESISQEVAREIKSEFYKVADQRTAWLTASQLEALKGLCERWQLDNPGVNLTENVAIELINQVPLQIDIVVERAIEVLQKRNLLVGGEEERKKAANILKNDATLKKHLRNTGGAFE
jgi:hypothetical protein